MAEITLPPVLGILRVAANTQHHQQPHAQQHSAGRADTPLSPLPFNTELPSTITGQLPNNQLQLTFSGGQTLIVTADKPYPVGTQVNVVLQSNGEVAILSLTLPPSTQKLQILNQFQHQWPQLSQFISQLQSQAAQGKTSAQQQLTTLGQLLQPSSTHMWGFITALTQHNITPLLAQAKLNPTTQQELDADLTKLHTLAQKPEGASTTPTDNWRSILFPYIESATDSPQQGHFAWRHTPAQEDTPATTRFVLDIALSQLGNIRCDGLLADESVTLKLISTTALPPKQQEDICQTIQHIFSQFGYTATVHYTHSVTLPPSPHTLPPDDAHNTHLLNLTS